MSEPSKAMPSEWVARLFLRFRSIYGNRADSTWGTADHADLVATWADELGQFDAEDVRMALEAMRFAYKEFPPTLYQFADLCRDARRGRASRSTKINVAPLPVDVQRLAELHTLARNLAERKRDPKDWARRLLQREQSGEKASAYALQCAKEALGLVVAEPAEVA